MTSHYKVAEAFAHHMKSKGSRVYTDGEVIYSYGSHFPMGVWQGNHVLVTQDKYSRSTSSHQSYLRRALEYNKIRYKQVPLATVEKQVERITERNSKKIAKKNMELALKMDRERNAKIDAAKLEAERPLTIEEVLGEYRKERKRMRA